MAGQHTPLPWFIHEEPYDYPRTSGGTFVHAGECGEADKGLDIVASVWTSSTSFDGAAKRKANAEFIVRACNSHDDLLEALEKCRDKFLHYEDLHRLKCTAEGDEKADRNREMADMCSAAIDRARGDL